MTYLTEHPGDFDVRIIPSGTATRPGLRFSIDTPEDLAWARCVAAAFYPSRDFCTSEILNWVDAN